MSQSASQSSTAVLEDTDTTTAKPGYKMYAILMLNDDDHTFDYVTVLLNKIFKHPVRKCHELAQSIHKHGKTVVWTGTLEHCELKVEQVNHFEPDTYGHKLVEYPLRTRIERI
jgi:ATP-dependent Clp protease adaptor protein ClpS